MKFKRKSFELHLTEKELVHLRDLMSIVLPPDGKSTVSQELANSQNRLEVEGKLWDKIADCCKKNNVQIEDAAPDFVITLNSPISLSIYQLKQQQQEEQRYHHISRENEQPEFFDLIMNKKKEAI